MTNYIKIPQFVLFITVLFLGCTKTAKKELDFDYIRIDITQTIQSNKSIDSIIHPYRKHLKNEIQTVIGYSSITMHKKDGELESTIGNLMADAVLEEVTPLFQSKTNQKIDQKIEQKTE